MTDNTQLTDCKIAERVSFVSIAVNLFLSLFKFAAGVIAHSGAMISDSVHSASDVFSSIIVIIGYKISDKKPDKDHPYGHERFECITSIVLAVILLITGLGIGKSTIDIIIGSSTKEILVPGTLAQIAALVSILIKELLYRYTIVYAKKINSSSLRADAWHHRSDALSSIGALIGITGAKIGYPIAEPIASLVICLFILKAVYDIFKDAVDKLVDKSCDDETTAAMTKVIKEKQGVESLVSLKTRMFGSKIYVDVIISADGTLPLTNAHQIAQTVHDDIEEKFPNVKHCTVHVDPCKS
ncbi:MAG: cation diffusion facilitator family transporter [Acutalibacteraceae bacterium]|nr:cation diffusion facilitator family transporter [Acutalibacteraceae bacterium]